jgi:hypothetical protein
MTLWHHKDEVVAALRREFDARGLPAAIDTVALQRSVTLLAGDGSGDGARAVFQVAADADAAERLLVDGRWPPTMPARVVVLPATTSDDAPWFVEMLQQIGVRVLFYVEPAGATDRPAGDTQGKGAKAGADLTFPGLDDLLARLD